MARNIKFEIWYVQFIRRISTYFELDPCKETKCGINAICKVVFSTGKTFCACPYLMVGDPLVKCGKFYIIKTI